MNDVEEMMTVCMWPECDCVVPEHSCSAYNRTQYCMQLALKQDGDKLEQLTGEDHGPWIIDAESS